MCFLIVFLKKNFDAQKWCSLENNILTISFC